tara:strand:- start:2369 stop:2902 length:534 start_codon:yes stop_codon:yes gene_type:complete
MANTYKLDIVVNAYKYLNQRKIIKKYYSELICDWISDIDNVNHLFKYDYIKFSIKELLSIIKEGYNLLNMHLKNIEFKFNVISRMDDMFFGNGFTIIIALNDELYVKFEDDESVKLEKGDAIYFYNDVRFHVSLSKDNKIVENIRMICIDIDIDTVELVAKLDGWWVYVKDRDKLLI